MSIERKTYERQGGRRTVTGVWKIGQGKGPTSKVGRVWWRVDGGDEQHCDVAAFLAWLSR